MRLKPYDAPRQKRTRAQDAATDRNFRIFRLRGLYYELGMFTGWRRRIARWMLDREFTAMGALTMAQHWKKQGAEMRARWSREDEKAFDEVPF